MGRISRFAEPMILLLLRERGKAHGYELIAAVGEEPPLCGEESAMDSAAVYRALRSMEEAGFLVSSWATEGGGPARRIYEPTPLGRERLTQWVERLGRMAEAMRGFVERGQRILDAEPRAGREPESAGTAGRECRGEPDGTEGPEKEEEP
jgi:DNA-binding PadR family transcriptional regulator